MPKYTPARRFRHLLVLLLAVLVTGSGLPAQASVGRVLVVPPQTTTLASSPATVEVFEPSDGLVAEYRFEGSATDVVGARHGTDSGIDYVAGTCGTAANFSTGDFVSLPSQALGDFTVAGWFRETQVNGGWARFWDFGSPTSSNGNFFLSPRHGRVSGGGLGLGIHDSTGDSTADVAAGVAGGVDTSQWHHITVTYDKAGAGSQLYVDGVSVGTETRADGTAAAVSYDEQSFEDFDPASQNWLLGKSNWPADAAFVGLIDELRIYDRALSAAEIAAVASLPCESPRAGSWVAATAVTPHGAWATLPGAQWVGSSQGQGFSSFRASFQLPAGFTDASLSGLMAADNVATVRLNNGPALASGVEYGAGEAFSAETGFVEGTNYLQFTVENHDGPGANLLGLSFNAELSFTPPNGAPVVSVPASLVQVNADSAEGAPATFAATADDAEDGALTPACVPASGSMFAVGDTTVTCTATDTAGLQDSGTFTVRVLDEVNTGWPTARVVGSGTTTSQRLLQAGQARWYRFPVQPDMTVQVDLTSLPADYDLTLFRDISTSFDEINSPRDLALLSAEFAADAFSPSAFSPSAFSPSAFSPSAFSPSAFSPSAFSPSAFSPSAFSPSAFSPSAFSPSAFSPSAFSPSAFSPSAFSPSAFSPSAFSPAGNGEEALRDAFSSAQTRSLISVSANNGLADESIRASTWNATGDFYVRVQGRNGAFDPAASYTLTVSTTGGSCGTPLSEHKDRATVDGEDGSASTVLLMDSSRLPGITREEIQAFAARKDVNGVVVDAATIPRVQALNEQADRQVACPHAKNLVAQALRDIVNSYRDSSGTLQHVVLVGDDNVIPFFRYADSSGLGPEENYVPPVAESTASQSSLRRNQVLSQDAYGARRDVTLKGATVPVADLAVGRLVETPEEIRRMLGRFVAGNGVLPQPRSALVTGYDFLTDAADEVAGQWGAGLGGSDKVDQLITDQHVPFATTTVGGVPDRSRSWTADDLRSALKKRRHDLVYLAGHFSANSALAADHKTSIITADVMDPAVSLEDTVVLSAGCHSGYNIVDGHAVPGLTYTLDWPQAFASRGATLVAGTGYQYGDTDFLEYSERLYGDLTSELREGSGPVAIGTALLRAKQDYLGTTAVLSGIHHKALLEATLYGLPMLGMDLPSGRTAASTADSAVSAAPVGGTGPGSALGLAAADVAPQMTTTEKSKPWTDPDSNATGQFTWLTGSDGVTTSPGQPALPLEVQDVTVPGQVLRGVGFRGGTYTDTAGVTPLTGAPATDFSEPHTVFSSPVFFPRRLAVVNHFGAIAGDGSTRLLVTPAQHRSDSATTSTLRRYQQLDLKLLYSGNVQKYGSNVPALAAPPTISGVASTLASSTGGDVVTFTARVVGDPSAGIESVWVTHTAEQGAGHGTWASVDLTQDAADTTTWKGTLTLPAGQDPKDVRFIVQAANGVGLVSMDDNLGEEYRLATSPGFDAPPATGQRTATTTSLVEPPASGAFGQLVTLQARVSSLAGDPVIGQPVRLAVGSSSRVVSTDETGLAAAGLRLVDQPGSDYAVSATYVGGDATMPSRALSVLSVTKRPTTLSVEVAQKQVGPHGDPGVTAQLLSAGSPVAGKTVYFTSARNGQVVSAGTALTDTAGRARFSGFAAPPGSHTITASFGAASVDLGGGSSAPATDREYDASSATGTIEVSDWPAPSGGGGGGGAPQPAPTQPTPSVPPSPPRAETSDSTGGPATEAQPAQGSVTSPIGGSVRIAREAVVDPVVDGFRLLDAQFQVSAPVARADAPLVLEFRLHSSLLPEGADPDEVQVLRNRVHVGECPGSTVADPDPCVTSRRLVGEQLVVRVLTSRASEWNLALTAPTPAPTRPRPEPAPTSGCDEAPKARFPDVAATSTHRDAIDCAAFLEIARGLTATTYGPERPVTRAQMAAFLARTVRVSGRSLPAGGDRFGDDDSDVHQGDINALAAAGIIQGKSSGRYDPTATVSRDQMATFLVRAYEKLTGTGLPAGPDAFDDDALSVHQANINQVAAAGLAQGTSPSEFQPTAPVRRDQMATFLTRLHKQAVVDTTTVPAWNGLTD